MENQQFSPPPGQMPLPNASAVMVLGILSIVGCFCYGIPGVILSIIALILYSRDRTLYASNPGIYSPQSWSNLKTGRICAIIGLIPSILFFLVWICLMVLFGIGVLTDPSHYMRDFNR